MPAGKKEREREILELVYAFRLPFEIANGEQPDFRAKLHPNDEKFGIEVTEFFHSESSARLARIPGYTGDLLTGGGFRHKDDLRELKVDKIQILSGDIVKHKDVAAIVQQVPPLRECAAKVAEIIRTKSAKLEPAFKKLRHINLIICDQTNLLMRHRPGDFYRSYCTETLVKTVLASSFREIYFVLNLSVGEVFLPLKMITTLAQFYFFQAAVSNRTVFSRLDPRSDFMECFGAYLHAVTRSKILMRDCDGQWEVIYGDTGFLFDDETRALKMRMYQDTPLESYGPMRQGALRVLDDDLVELIQALQKESTFASGVAFRTTSGEYAGD